MFLTIKKKTITIFTVMLLLLISLILICGWIKQEPTPLETSTDNVLSDGEQERSSEAVMVSAKEKNLSDVRFDRDVVRSKTCELLTNTLNDENITDTSKQEVENRLLKMAEDMDKEIACEAILKTKGYSDCVVFISDDKVNVTVVADNLNDEDVAKINDAVLEITSVQDIKISLTRNG